MGNRRFEQVINGIKSQGLTQILLTDKVQIEFITNVDTKNEKTALLINSVGKIILAISKNSSIENIPHDIFCVVAEEGEHPLYTLLIYLQSGSIGISHLMAEDTVQYIEKKRCDTVVMRFKNVAGINSLIADA